MLSITLLILPLPILTLLTFTISRKHLLIALLSLEATILVITLLLACLSPLHILSIITLLTIAACEARVGLAIMVLITRTTGSDTLSTLNLNK